MTEGKQIEVDLDARFEMIAYAARHYLDAPFELYARDPNIGVDCLGLVALSATRAGFDCWDMLFRTVDPNTGKLPKMMGAIAKHMEVVKLKKDIRVGDMLWFHMVFGMMSYEADHLAVVTSINPIRMIHADPLFCKRVVECGLTDSPLPGKYPSYIRPFHIWDDWLRGAFRFKNLSFAEDPKVSSALIVSHEYGRKLETMIDLRKAG